MLAEIVGPEPREAAAEVKIEEARTEAVVSREGEVKAAPQEDQDIHPHPPRPVATAITCMATKLGTVWRPSHARGRTSASPGEGPASLSRKIQKYSMTSCFPA